MIVLFASSVFAQDAPRTFFANGNKIALVRESLKKNEKTYKTIFASFIRSTDKLLSEKPRSVISKKQTPPSGDKHDYMSLAPYWWPDSSGDETSPYVRYDGQRNPEIYGVKDHENYAKTCQNIFSLALAFQLTNDEKYAEKAVELMSVWFLNPDTRMNPNLNFAQAIKGKNNGRGAGLIDDRYIIYLIDGMQMLKDSPRFTMRSQIEMKAWLTDFLTWITESKNGKDENKAPNNHGTWYDAQVTAIALGVGNIEIARLHAERLKERIATQITPEGKEPFELTRTNSFSYSFFNLEALCTLSRLASNLGINGWEYKTEDGKSIRKAVEFLYPYMIDEKTWGYQQISPRKTDVPVSAMLMAYGGYGNSEWLTGVKKLCGDSVKELSILLYL
jgi:hypothetical protein